MLVVACLQYHRQSIKLRIHISRKSLIVLDEVKVVAIGIGIVVGSTHLGLTPRFHSHQNVQLFAQLGAELGHRVRSESLHPSVRQQDHRGNVRVTLQRPGGGLEKALLQICHRGRPFAQDPETDGGWIRCCIMTDQVVEKTAIGIHNAEVAERYDPLATISRERGWSRQCLELPSDLRASIEETGPFFVRDDGPFRHNGGPEGTFEVGYVGNNAVWRIDRDAKGRGRAEALVQHLQLLQPIAVGDGRTAVLLVDLVVQTLTFSRAVHPLLALGAMRACLYAANIAQHHREGRGMSCWLF